MPPAYTSSPTTVYRKYSAISKSFNNAIPYASSSKIRRVRCTVFMSWQQASRPNGSASRQSIPFLTKMEFTDYIQKFQTGIPADAYMAVTDFVDDEKPLYIETDDALHIRAFCDEPTAQSRYVSGGIYAFTQAVIPVLKTRHRIGHVANAQLPTFTPDCRSERRCTPVFLHRRHRPCGRHCQSRNFYSHSQTSTAMNRICAGISRASRFSSNRESNDNAVFSQVAAYLRENGLGRASILRSGIYKPSAGRTIHLPHGA